MSVFSQIYQKTRKSDHPKEFMKNFEGIVVCDGYSAYRKLNKENPDIKTDCSYLSSR